MTRARFSRAAVLGVLQELISTPSVNPALSNQGEGEKAVATLINSWFLSKGISSRLEEVVLDRPNVVARIGNSEGPTLVLCGHLDTVGTEGMISPFEPKLEGTRVYGRGSCDMKGGVAAIMVAAAALAKRPLAGNVLVALVVDEEYASIGAQDFVAHHEADACIITESSGGALIVAHKGFVWLEVNTHGRPAHGSRWDIGISAIGKMGRVIEALDHFDEHELRRRSHPLMGPASQHCALIEGGSGLSTYAERCTLKIERRTLPGETPEEILQQVRDLVSSVAEDADVRLLLHRPPLVCPPNARVSECLKKAIHSVGGAAPAEIGVGSWMDSALFSAAGMETVLYGPVGEGLHELVEWVDLDSVITCAEVLTETALLFCKK